MTSVLHTHVVKGFVDKLRIDVKSMRIREKPLTNLVDRDFFHVLFITHVDMGYESPKYAERGIF